jgi:hypothetical protein
MRSTLVVSLVVLAACNAPDSSTREVTGQLTDSSVQAVFSETSSGQQTVAAVGPDGRFRVTMPVQTPVTLILAARNAAGGFTAVKHVGPTWFVLKSGPLLDLGLVHAAAGAGGIMEGTGATDADGGTAPPPTHMCPNSSGSSDDGHDGSGHDGDGSSDGSGSNNSGPGMADGGSSSGSSDGSDCHESDDDTCGGMTVSGCGEDDRDDCDNEDEMQSVDAADAGVSCPSHS